MSPQCVNSGCLTSEFAGNVTNKYCLCLSTYVSAFGFVGFILFSFLFGHLLGAYHSTVDTFASLLLTKQGPAATTRRYAIKSSTVFLRMPETIPKPYIYIYIICYVLHNIVYIIYNLSATFRCSATFGSMLEPKCKLGIPYLNYDACSPKPAKH